MSEVIIDLLPHQMQFMQSNKPITIMICGRGSGKSFAAGIKIATLLTSGKSVIFIAQNFRMVKKVMLAAIEDALHLIGISYEKNLGDMTIKVGSATAHGFSAESTESIRGLTNIKALVIDEAALCNKDTFDIACACLRGQGEPEIYLISTPRGRGNYLNSLINDPENEVIRATTYDNTFLDASFVKLLEKQYDEDFARQELFGEILNMDETNQMIKTVLLNSAVGKVEEQPNWKITFGLDCARFGKDKTVIYVRKGKNLIDRESLDKSDTHDIVTLVEKYERKYGKDKIASIAIDVTGGFGAGPFDILSRNRKNVISVDFSAKSPNPHLKNMRTYLYQLAIEYIENGGKIGYNNDLFEELVAQEYSINNNGLKQLSPKEIVKQKLGRSCDDSDSFALCLVTTGDMFKDDTLIKEIKDAAFNYRFNAIGKKAGFVNDK